MATQSDFYLYHYTTAEGLIGIIEQREIWTTDIFYLNDSKEFRWAIDLARRQLRTWKDLPARCESMAMALPDVGPLQRCPVYVCSFSEEEDDLNQWRAYCPQGGFSVGLLKSKLGRVAKRQGFDLDRCVYGSDEQTSMITDAIRSVISEGDRERVSSPPILSLDFDELEGRWLRQAITKVAPLIKHKTFAAENEWRLVSITKDSESRENFGVRVRGSMVVPYRTVKLKESVWDRARIIVGPCPHVEENKVCVARLLLHSLRPETQFTVKTTSTPYCYW
ncbi:MAG: DUF2971 domain-containing protein [Phycisphaerae bacterium]|nr:DUF2971 domain-containing protein [Phycisphaerae bacterium]